MRYIRRYSEYDLVNADVHRKMEDFMAFAKMIGIPKGTLLLLEGDAAERKAVAGSTIIFGIYSEKVDSDFLRAAKSFVADIDNVRISVYEGDALDYAIESGVPIDEGVLSELI